MTDESADPLVVLMTMFDVRRCVISGRQRRCVVEVSVVTPVELTTKFDVHRRCMTVWQRWSIITMMELTVM